MVSVCGTFRNQKQARRRKLHFFLGAIRGLPAYFLCPFVPLLVFEVAFFLSCNYVFDFIQMKSWLLDDIDLPLFFSMIRMSSIIFQGFVFMT